MSDNWRTDEPEVGAVAWLKTGSGKQVFTCIVLTDTDTDPKCWFDGNGSWVNLKDGDNWRDWLPITTPEERRLRAEVERLRGAIRQHQEYTVLHVYDGELPDIQDRELWATIETEAGEADRG